MARSNKNSANEDQVGYTHGLVSKLTNMKLEHMIEMVESGELDPDVAINMRDVQIAAKWCEYNEIGALTANAEEESPLKKNLKRIQEAQGNKILAFAEPER